MKTKEELIDGLLDLAFAEDIGDGDHTTLCCIPDDEMGKQHLLLKEEGVLAGVDIALKVFKKFDPTLKVTVFINDGAHVKPGDIAFEVEGKVRSLLQTERLMLNIMQRMSGIATMTAKYAAELKGLKAKVLDTRKTTPGMRMLEKEAVRIGGGMNHRIGLFDMILLKDNHVDFAGGIKNAINKAHQYLKDNHKEGMQIEIEVRNFDELREVLEIGGVDRIMLDNRINIMAPEAGTNFVLVQGDKAIVQLAFNNGFSGLNGLGGITVEGSINNRKTKVSKKGDISYDFSVNGTSISAQVYITVYKNTNQAMVYINPNFNSNSMTVYGPLIPYDHQGDRYGNKVFQGRTFH